MTRADDSEWIKLVDGTLAARSEYLRHPEQFTNKAGQLLAPMHPALANAINEIDETRRRLAWAKDPRNPARALREANRLQAETEQIARDQRAAAAAEREKQLRPALRRMRRLDGS